MPPHMLLQSLPTVSNAEDSTRKTDGQTERQNQTLRQYPTCKLCGRRAVKLGSDAPCSRVCVSYNNSLNSTLGRTSFYELYRFNPEIHHDAGDFQAGSSNVQSERFMRG